MALRILFHGISGKFGKTILEHATKDPNIHIIGGIASASSLVIGQDASILTTGPFLNAPIRANINSLIPKSDVIIDTSHSNCLNKLLNACIKYQKPVVIGTTGFSEEQKELIRETAKTIPIFWSSNFSLGMASFLYLANKIAKYFPFTEIDIIETHHAMKKDAPSGTAKILSEEIEKASSYVPRIHSIRAGQVVGEHTILFHSEDECIEIKHHAHSRKIFAHGAINAAKFLHQKPAGLYTMKDLLKTDLQ